jgi:hypothetical protein
MTNNMQISEIILHRIIEPLDASHISQWHSKISRMKVYRGEV